VEPHRGATVTGRSPTSTAAPEALAGAGPAGARLQQGWRWWGSQGAIGTINVTATAASARLEYPQGKAGGGDQRASRGSSQLLHTIKRVKALPRHSM
jgi:hypothetical protein